MVGITAQTPLMDDPTGQWDETDGVVSIITRFETLYHPSGPRSREPFATEQDGDARVLLINRSGEERSGELICALFHSADVGMPLGEPISFHLPPNGLEEFELTSLYIESASSMRCSVNITES